MWLFKTTNCRRSKRPCFSQQACPTCTLEEWKFLDSKMHHNVDMEDSASMQRQNIIVQNYGLLTVLVLARCSFLYYRLLESDCWKHFTNKKGVQIYCYLLSTGQSHSNRMVRPVSAHTSAVHCCHNTTTKVLSHCFRCLLFLSRSLVLALKSHSLCCTQTQ